MHCQRVHMRVHVKESYINYWWLGNPCIHFSSLQIICRLYGTWRFQGREAQFKFPEGKYKIKIKFSKKGLTAYKCSSWKDSWRRFSDNFQKGMGCIHEKGENCRIVMKEQGSTTNWIALSKPQLRLHGLSDVFLCSEGSNFAFELKVVCSIHSPEAYVYKLRLMVKYNSEEELYFCRFYFLY